MKRSHELIAGYVLGNLSKEEFQELETILTAKSELRTEIARLRKTATVQSNSLRTQVVNGLEWSAESQSTNLDETDESSDADQQRGWEGWSDGGENLPEASFLKVERLLLPPTGCYLHQASNCTGSISANLVCLRQRLAKAGASFGWWLLLLILAGIGIDNWQLRRSKVLAQPEFIQPTSVHEAPFTQ